MFIPNSPSPPRGMAVRGREVWLKEASTPGRTNESYHTQGAADLHSSAHRIESVIVSTAEEVCDGDQDYRAESGRGQRIPESSTEDSKFHENPPADEGADEP